MVNKCSAYGCSTGLLTQLVKNDEKIATFHFPLKKPDLLNVWKKFVNRRDWNPTQSSVVCEKHFADRLVTRGKRTTLNWSLNPIPTIHSELACKRPSTLTNVTDFRKPPKIRNVLPDQMNDFTASDTITDLKDIDTVKHCPPGFQCKRDEDHVLFYKLIFDKETDFPVVQECIRIDTDLHVKLLHNGNPIPLPKWFAEGHNAKLTRFSMLGNFPAYIANAAQDHPFSILEELRKRQHYKPKGRPPFSSQLIRYALLLRYTSPQSYRILLQKFPLPSFSTLSKLQQGGVNSLRAAKRLLDAGEISSDIVLMTDEIHLQQGTQFQGGEYVGANEDGKLYKGIVVFMINGIKKPFQQLSAHLQRFP